jgi:hypothetical protein
MLLWTLVGLVWAGAPTHVDLNDIDHWEMEATRVLDGPSGCWEIVGQASWSWDAGRWGGSRGDQVFLARMVDGVWQEFRIQALGEVQHERRGPEHRVYVDDDARFIPLVGRVAPGGVVVDDRTPDLVLQAAQVTEREQRRDDRQEARREQRRDADDSDTTAGPRNAIRRALDRLSGSAETSWAQWNNDREAVVLYRSIPMGDGRRGPVTEETFVFPAGGPPTELDIQFPDRFMVGGVPRYSINNAEAHVRVRPSGGQLFPTMESYKIEFGVFGFSVTGAQTIVYKSARPCVVRGSDVQPPG